MTQLDTNLAVFAGAGTGKTHALMTMCLHLLAGIRAGRLTDPLPASQLTLLTFTDKAAAQLQARLRERVHRLCEGDADEPDLRDSFEALGHPMPGTAHWKAVRSQLANADIGTFHALCLKLLKGAPAGRGVSPAVEVLDERASDELLRGTVEKWVIAGLERREVWLGDLVRGLEYPGVVEGLLEVYRKAREDGVPFEEIAVGDAEASRCEFESRRVALRNDLIAERAVLKPATKTAKGEQRFSSFFDDAVGVLENSSLETFCDQAAPLVDVLKGTVIAGIRVRLEALGAVAMAAQLAPYEAHLRDALTHVGNAYQRALQQRQAIDFTDIMVKCRDLLRDDTPFREAAQRDIGTLLVDEFQDTNRVQLDVVRLLAAKRDDAGSQSEALEPAFLAVVGDRKQSIYDFRGADVAVFETMAQAIERANGRRVFLKTSRRASPDLVKVFNQTFPSLLGPTDAPRGYDVVYQAEHDDMLAHRQQQLQTPAVVRLNSAKVDAAASETRDAQARRAAEADGLARYLSQLFRDGKERVVDEHTQRARAARPGDVAMLFRTFSQVEVYRQALVRHRVRHTVCPVPEDLEQHEPADGLRPRREGQPRRSRGADLEPVEREPDHPDADDEGRRVEHAGEEEVQDVGAQLGAADGPVVAAVPALERREEGEAQQHPDRRTPPEEGADDHHRADGDAPEAAAAAGSGLQGREGWWRRCWWRRRGLPGADGASGGDEEAGVVELGGRQQSLLS